MNAMEEREDTGKDRMGSAIVKGVLIGVPVVLVGLTLGIFLITDNDLADSFATAILPGILLGVFGGGFAGMALTME
ncbi:MAG: hypothetical protein DWQ40_01805 [Actinobacteria bacterium]|nr:MAG: hypothetical protein DWQ40_01805 [Actinomycetota bacterium]